MEGYASWYGDQFHGHLTANGEKYDMYRLTAAHRDAPFGSLVKVTNLENHRTTQVRVNDRGPFVRGRIIDLSRAAAKELGMLSTGTTRVRLEFLGTIAPAEPEAPPQAPSATETSPKEVMEKIYLQAGAFRGYQNAKVFVEEFSSFHPELKPQIVEQDGFFRVWLGPYPTAAEATDIQTRLKGEGKETVLLHR